MDGKGKQMNRKQEGNKNVQRQKTRNKEVKKKTRK